MVDRLVNKGGIVGENRVWADEGIRWEAHSILMGKVHNLNERLCLWNKSTTRIAGILRRAWFDAVNISGIRDFVHYKWTSWDFQEKQALYLQSLGKFVRFWDAYVCDNISAQLLDDNGIKFLWFIVEIEGKTYVYDLSSTWEAQVLWEQGYIDRDEARDTLDKRYLNTALKWKGIQEQLMLLKSNWFKSFQRSSILELEHYMRRNNSWSLDVILYDNAHRVLLQFGSGFIADEITVSRWPMENSVNGLIVKRWVRYFYYILWQQYRETYTPRIRANPNAQDGGFESMEMLDAYVEYWYNNWNKVKN